MKLIFIVLAVAAAGTTVLGAGEGKGGGTREVRYPTDYKAVVDNSGGKPVVIVFPTRFRTREVGTTMDSSVNGVVRVEGKRNGRDVITVQFDDGRTATFEDLTFAQVGRDRYQALGWKGSAYRLRNIRTGQMLSFRRGE